MQNIQEMILNRLNNAMNMVKMASRSERFDLIAPHSEYPNIETYIVDLVNSLDKELSNCGHKVSKSLLLKIVQQYAGEEDANEKRTEEILKLIS